MCIQLISNYINITNDYHLGYVHKSYAPLAVAVSVGETRGAPASR